MIVEERDALGHERQIAWDSLAEALRAALPADGEGAAARLGHLEPDIVGDTFCLLVLATNPDLDQGALTDRCRKRAPGKAAQHLILTLQDFARSAEELAAEATQRSRRTEARLLPGWLGGRPCPRLARPPRGRH